MLVIVLSNLVELGCHWFSSQALTKLTEHLQNHFGVLEWLKA